MGADKNLFFFVKNDVINKQVETRFNNIDNCIDKMKAYFA